MKEVELDDHQRQAVARLRNGKILSSGVGSGKTRVAMQYYTQNEWESELIVITTAKKRDSRDWEDEAAEHGIGTDRDASLGKTITVDSWNNLWRYVDRAGAFFVFDEQRLVGSGAWVKVFLKIAKNNQWIMLSATPGDTWLDYIPVFVANGLYKNRTEFLREHVVYSRYSKFPKVERYIGVGRLVKHRNDLLVDLPYQRLTTRHIKTVDVDYDVELFKKVVKERWHVYENRPLRDVAELFAVMRKVANSDESRLKAIRQLMDTHPRVIVFYNFDYELEILRTLTSVIFQDATDSLMSVSIDGLDRSHSLEGLFTPTSSEQDGSKPGNTIASQLHSTEFSMPQSVHVAEWNGHKHQSIPTSDRWVYLVQYTAGAEGWNCVETNTVCFYSLNYSYRLFEQCQGRIDRRNTLFIDLWYYVLRSNSVIDQMIWKAVKSKEFFNESKAVKNLGK